MRLIASIHYAVFMANVLVKITKQMGVAVLATLLIQLLHTHSGNICGRAEKRQASCHWTVRKPHYRATVINNRYNTEACCCRSSVYVQYSKTVFLHLEQQTMNQSLTWGSKLSEILFVCSSLISRGFLRLMWATSSTPFDHSWKTLSSYLDMDMYTCTITCVV